MLDPPYRKRLTVALVIMKSSTELEKVTKKPLLRPPPSAQVREAVGQYTNKISVLFPRQQALLGYVIIFFTAVRLGKS